jgi:PAS domain S-box-containing protein
MGIRDSQLQQSQYTTNVTSEKAVSEAANSVTSMELSLSFRLLVEAMEEGIVILSKDGKVAYFNDSFSHIMGLPIDQITGRKLETIVPASFAREILTLITDCRADSHLKRKTTIMCNKTETSFPIYVSANCFTLESVIVPFLVFTDSRTCVDESLKNLATCLEHEIVKYKQSEIDLIRSNTLLSDIINSTDSRIAVRDTKGILVLINDAEAQHLEKSRNEAIGKTPHELYSPDAADELLREDKIILSSGKALRVEIESSINGLPHVFLKNIFPLKNKDGEIYGVSSVTVDITEYKKIEKSLRESEQSFREVFENTVFGIVLLDEQMRILKINRMFEQITGYTEEDLLCESVSLFSYSNDVKNELSLLRTIQRKHQGCYELEKRIICKDGGVRWVKVTGTAMYRRNGDFLYLVNTVEDITKRKLIERQLDRYRANLEQLVEERTRQLMNVQRSAIVGQAAGIIGQQLLLKYIFNEQ